LDVIEAAVPIADLVQAEQPARVGSVDGVATGVEVGALLLPRRAELGETAEGQVVVARACRGCPAIDGSDHATNVMPATTWHFSAPPPHLLLQTNCPPHHVGHGLSQRGSSLSRLERSRPEPDL
jgi:hypothetical protein